MKQNMRIRFLLGLVIAVIAFVGLAACIPASSATVKLNRKKVTLTVGETYQLKLKNAEGKIKFSSSDKKIAKVSSTGLITAVSEGKTKIKVKNAGVTYKCTVTVEKTVTETNDQAVYDAIIALMDIYPEGTPWTNANSYKWGPGPAGGMGYGGFTGYGCQAFAMIASDAAFGDVPAYEFFDKSKIRVGDIIRINGDTHSVIVLKIEGSKLTIAEGNYNSSIHWGRVIDLDDCGFDYGYTRYDPNS